MPHTCCSTTRNTQHSLRDILKQQDLGDNDHHHRDDDGRRSFTLREHLTPSSYAPDLQLEPTHMDIHLKFDDDSLDNHRFQVRVVHHVRCNHDHQDPKIEFNGHQFHHLSVKDVTQSSSLGSSGLQWTYDGELIRVQFEGGWKRGEERLIELMYTVDSPLSSIAFHYRKSFLGDQKVNEPGDSLGRYAVTDHETERARFWLACVDYPIIRTTIDFYFTVPVEWSAYANGELKQESVLSEANDQLKLIHWYNSYPCPSYLICFAVGELMIAKDEDVVTMSGQKLPIAYIAPKGTNEQDLRFTFNKTRSIIKFLENKIQVPFPNFQKYYQVIAPRVSSAMENISLVSWDNMFLQDQTYAKEWKVETDIVVLHECSHSYFGDALVIRHFEHAWLKESFAKFFEATWAGHEYGHDERMYSFYLQKVSYSHEADYEYVRPIVTNKYDSSWDLFDRHLYPGGSWRLHMLMSMLGEDVFWSAIKNYVEQFSSNIVETIDFQRVLERTSSRNLTKFFEQWIFGCGYPILDMKYTYDMKKKTVKLLAKQTQMNQKRNIGYFDFELKVRVVTEKEELNGVLTFENGGFASITFNVDTEPTVILFDPNTEVLFKIRDDFNPGQTILLNTLRNAPDIFNRIFAAHQFIKHHASTSRLLMDDLIDALKKESFYGVRARIAHSLADIKSAHSSRALCWMLENESEPMAHMQVTKAMIGFRDENIKQSVLKYLQLADTELLPYITHGNALNVLASQWLTGEEEQQVTNLILKHIDNDKQEAYPVVKLLGYGALKYLSHSMPVYHHLLNRVTAERRQECLGTILKSIGSIASTLPSHEKTQATQLLVDYLRDEDDNVRYGAIRGLVVIGDLSVIGDIETCMNLFAHQYRPWVQHQINSLKQKKIGSNDNMQKEILKLQESVRKLQQQVAELK